MMYDLNNIGLGFLNLMKLDNLDDKRCVMDIYGVEDNKLVFFLYCICFLIDCIKSKNRNEFIWCDWYIYNFFKIYFMLF